jgi:truncated hemoglobin YjbI
MLDAGKVKTFKSLFNDLLKEDPAEVVNLIKNFAKGARVVNQKAYAKAVAARKQEREVKKAKRAALIAEAQEAKMQAKEKAAAAKALVAKKTKRAKVSKEPAPGSAFKPKTELIKRARRGSENLTPSEVVDSMAGGLSDLPNL